MTTSSNALVSVGTIDDFFADAHKIMKAIDNGETLTPQTTITFEDPKDMLQFISPKKMEVLTEIKKHPASITDIAKAVERNRSAVSKEIKEMERFGLVTIKNIINPGHGRSKIVNLTHPRLTLQAAIF
jgi:predicted transcriptional regulator